MTITNDGDQPSPGPEADDGSAPSFVQVRKRPRKTTWPWLLVAMGVIVVVSFFAGIGREWGDTGSLAGDLGYGLGASIIPAMLLGFTVYLILYFAVLKRSNRDNGGKYLAILVVTALLSGVGMSMAGGLVQRGGVDAARLQSAMDVAIAQQDALETRLEQEAAEGDEAFTAAALKRRGGYDRAVAEVERRRALIDQAVADDAAIAAELRQSVGSAYSNPAGRARVLVQFDAGRAERQPELAAFWDGQRLGLDLLEAHLGFLRRVSWSANGETFVFQRQRDLDSFNEQQAEIDRTIRSSELELQRLRAGQRAARRDLQSKLDRLS